MSIESLMPSNRLILCHLLLLLPSIFPSIRIFSNESALHIKWPKYKTPLLQLHNIHVFHYRSNEHELGQTPGDGGGRGGLACCSPQGCEESDTTGHWTATTCYMNEPKMVFAYWSLSRYSFTAGWAQTFSLMVCLICIPGETMPRIYYIANQTIGL